MAKILLSLILIAPVSEAEKIRFLLSRINEYKSADNRPMLKQTTLQLAAFSDRISTKGLFFVGSALTEKALWAEAIHFWKALQETDPEFSPRETGYLWALCYGGQGEMQKGIEILSSLGKRGIQDVESLLLLADLYTRKGDPESAVNYLKKAIAMDPDSLEGYLALGKLLHASRQFLQADRLYRKAMDRGIEHPQLLYQKASAMIGLGGEKDLAPSFRSKLFLGAYQLLRQLQDAVPPNAELHNQMGMALSKLGREDEAGRSFQRALELDPSSADYIVNLVVHYSEREEYDRSIQLLEELIATHPPSIEAYDRLFWLYWKTNRQNQGREILPALLALDPDRPRTHLLAARFYHDFGNLEKALEHSEIGIRLGANDFMAYHLRGLALSKQVQFEAARLAFEKALQLNPDHVDSLAQLGKIYMREGKDEMAEQYFVTVLQKDPDQVGVHFQLGTLYRKRGDLERARQELELFQKLSRKAKQR